MKRLILLLTLSALLAVALPLCAQADPMFRWWSVVNQAGKKDVFDVCLNDGRKLAGGVEAMPGSDSQFLVRDLKTHQVTNVVAYAEVANMTKRTTAWERAMRTTTLGRAIKAIDNALTRVLAGFGD